MATDNVARILALANSGGGSETTSHPVLSGRNNADQHPMSSITGLEEKITELELGQIIDAPTDNERYVRSNESWEALKEKYSLVSIVEWRQNYGPVSSGIYASGKIQTFFESFDFNKLGEMVYFYIYNTEKGEVAVKDIQFNTKNELDDYLTNECPPTVLYIIAYIRKAEMLNVSTTAYNTAYSMLRGKKKLRSSKRLFEARDDEGSTGKFIRAFTKQIYDHCLGDGVYTDEALSTIFTVAKTQRRFRFPTLSKQGDFYGNINTQQHSWSMYNSTTRQYMATSDLSTEEISFNYEKIFYVFVDTEFGTMEIREELKQYDIFHRCSVLVVAELVTEQPEGKCHTFRIYPMGIDTILINKPMVYAVESEYNIYIRVALPGGVNRYRLVAENVHVINGLYGRLYRVVSDKLRELIMSSFLYRNRGKGAEPEFSFILYDKISGVCSETDTFKLYNAPITQCNKITYK